MGPADKVQIIGLQKLCKDISAEKIADASFSVLVPSLLLLHGVRPQQIAQHALVGNIRRPVERQQFSNLDQLGTNPSVHAQNFFLDDSCDGHGVERIHEGLPDLERKLAFAFILWSVH